VSRPGQAAELLEDAEPPGGEHPLGGLGDGVEQARDGAAGLDDRAVGEGEVALLLEAVPGHHQRQVLVVRHPAGEDVPDHRLDVGPDVDPDVGHGLTKSLRMAEAEHRGVRVVVDHDELRTPHEQHGEP
jgi:hypothetical protein